MSDKPLPDRPNSLPDIPDETPTPQRTPPPNVPEWTPTSLRTPTPASGHVQQPVKSSGRRVRKRKTGDRSRNPLYVPAWSVGIMLLLVVGIVFSIIFLAMQLGGKTAPAGQPQVIIITAIPSNTPAVQQTATATTPLVEALPTFQGPIPTFALEGPTLAPIILSPTPVEITIGATVIVNVDGLNIRSEAGTGNKVVTNGNKGDRFTVIDGPQEANNYTWWHITDPEDPSRDGWAAADYLDVAIQ